MPGTAKTEQVTTNGKQGPVISFEPLTDDGRLNIHGEDGRVCPDRLYAIWRAFRETGDGELRHALALHYLPLAREVCRRCKPWADGRYLERMDHLSAAVLGLMQAIDSFNPEGVGSFGRFAGIRIRGAIADACRDLDVLGREARPLYHRMERAADRFYAEHGRRPDDDELAGLVGKSAYAFSFYRGLDGFAHPADVMVRDRRTGEQFPMSIPDSPENQPEQRVGRRDALVYLLRGLSLMQRRILLMRYRLNLQMKQIAQRLGVPAQHASKAHREALAVLRRQLGSYDRGRELIA